MRLSKKKFWVDKMEFPCALYEGAKWCTSSKGYGEGWNSFWGRWKVDKNANYVMNKS